MILSDIELALYSVKQLNIQKKVYCNHEKEISICVVKIPSLSSQYFIIILNLK